MPTVAGGNITFANDLNDNLPLVIRKQVDTTRISNATAAADPDLKVTLPAGRYYLLIGRIVFNSSTTADLRGGLYCPANGSYAGGYEGQPVGATGVSGTLTTDQVGVGNGYIWGGVGSDIGAQFIGIAYSGDGGDFGFTWAQGTLTATNTIVRANSFLSFFPCPF